MALASTFVSTSLSLSHPILSPRQSRFSRFVLPGTHLSPQLEILKVSPFAHGFGASPFGFSGMIRGSSFQIPVNSADVLGSLSLTSENDADTIPVPIVMIDQDSDPNATIVQLSFGDRLGALIDTMKAIKDLGLDVSKGTVTAGASDQTKFFITKMGRKVDDPAMLERIRLTIIINLLKYHPESSEKLALGAAFGIKAPKKKPDVDMTTNIHIQDDGPKRSLLYVKTPDRPGLLMEIIKMMADINLSVESAEIETEGLIVKDTFHVSYRGAALKDSLSQILVNSLRYHLLRPEIEEESY